MWDSFRSGLGLEAQKEAVAGFLNGGRWKLVEEVVEVESGKRSNRPQLARALPLCRVHRATLLVAKLDRVARNVAFISALMESGVAFQTVDLPNADDLTVHMAGMAEYEAKAISERAKDALAAANARGTKLAFHSWAGDGKRWEFKTVARKGNTPKGQRRHQFLLFRAFPNAIQLGFGRKTGFCTCGRLHTRNPRKQPHTPPAGSRGFSSTETNR